MTLVTVAEAIACDDDAADVAAAAAVEEDKEEEEEEEKDEREPPAPVALSPPAAAVLFVLPIFTGDPLVRCGGACLLFGRCGFSLHNVNVHCITPTKAHPFFVGFRILLGDAYGGIPA
jgi:hypothetical protein